MKEETIAKVAADLADWQMPPIDDWHGFVYRPSEKIVDDRREIFVCVNEDKHLSATAYFHEETREYKLRVKVGLNETVRIEFIAGNLADFAERLKMYFAALLTELNDIKNLPVPPLLKEKGIDEWSYGECLPPVCEGFALFIEPRAPFPVANGSYIIVDYSDFSIGSNFTLYYNIFRDEFFAEMRIAGVPTVTYDFDAKTLSRLTMIIKTKLATKLAEIRRETIAE